MATFKFDDSGYKNATGRKPATSVPCGWAFEAIPEYGPRGAQAETIFISNPMKLADAKKVVIKLLKLAQPTTSFTIHLLP